MVDDTNRYRAIRKIALADPDAPSRMRGRPCVLRDWEYVDSWREQRANEAQPDLFIERDELARRVDLVLGGLTDNQALVLRMRYGLPPYEGAGYSLREVAAILGRHVERIRQIEGKGLRLLRHPRRAKFLLLGKTTVLPPPRKEKERAPYGSKPKPKPKPKPPPEPPARDIDPYGTPKSRPVNLSPTWFPFRAQFEPDDAKRLLEMSEQHLLVIQRGGLTLAAIARCVEPLTAEGKTVLLFEPDSTR